jgi:outer membrane lipoprotein-sorting protein
MAIIDKRIELTAVLAVTCLIAGGVSAQTAETGVSAKPIVISEPLEEKQTSGASGQLSSRQVDLLDKVSAYFNQMNSLKGEFVQTSANGSRLRGKFYVKRPGRFRFDYARPSRLVIVSDGRQVAIQDHDLKSDDRFELGQTPMAVLLRQDVNLLRDARILDAQETEDAIVIAFEDKDQPLPGPLRMILGKKPMLELKKWRTKDLQGFDTQIELSNIVRTEDFGPDLFKPAPVGLDRFR